MEVIKGLCPIRNFGILQDKKLYRGAQPLYEYEYEWLRNLGVKYIINLRSESHHDDNYSHLFTKVFNVGFPDHGIPTRADIIDFIRVAKTYSGIFFHCEHGRGRTSMFAVIARLSMGWTLEKALEEEKVKFKYEFQHPKQLEFLKNLKLWQII